MAFAFFGVVNRVQRIPFDCVCTQSSGGSVVHNSAPRSLNGRPGEGLIADPRPRSILKTLNAHYHGPASVHFGRKDKRIIETFPLYPVTVSRATVRVTRREFSRVLVRSLSTFSLPRQLML